MIENRTQAHQKGLITVATGEYNEFIPSLITSAKKKFGCHVYVFTDQPKDYEHFRDITVIEIEHYGWPKMPLLRFELLYKHKELFRENYLFLIDSEAKFIREVNQSVLGYRVGTLHRNITRHRDEFNYETRKESTAFVDKKEGEKYYACGFVGGHKKEFNRMCKIISANIRTDISNNIRSRWGDESHLNRYFIDNRPTVVLPPNYMCPATNHNFVPFIIHRDKTFKRVNIEDTDRYLNIDKKDYER